MPPFAAAPELDADDLAFQARLLQGVSRTFALTIPQLPPPLRAVVGNGYLLCRITDTIEDDAGLSPEQKQGFAERFAALAGGGPGAAEFARELHPLLTDSTLPAEHELVRDTERVLGITRHLAPAQQAALGRCVRIMARGMAEHQRPADSRQGVADLAALERYCYVVAGVVGEMLTELFCDYSPAMAARREPMMDLAVSFGAALQMTNILKDVWEDRRRGACWLPRDIFVSNGVDLESISAENRPIGFETAMLELVAHARGHALDGLRYVRLIPPAETGIRRFCLWALGMAVLTLRRVALNPGYRRGSEVKISRRAVRWTALATNAFAANDRVLGWMFAAAARSLPPAVPPSAEARARCRGDGVAGPGSAVSGAAAP